MRIRHFLFLLVVFFAQGFFCSSVIAQEKIVWDSSKEIPGVYFHWYEPSLYSGFAPRTQDPTRVHIRLSRGNQVRVTLALSDADIDSYLPTLVKRQKIYQELLDSKAIELSTNLEYERYLAELVRLNVKGLLSNPATDRRAVALKLMKELNPGRVFQIRMSISKLFDSWRQFVISHAVTSKSKIEEKLDAANAILPGRLNLYLLEASVEKEIDALLTEVTQDASKKENAQRLFVEILSRLSSGVYSISNEELRATEFTSIYPTGTMDSWVDYKGKKIPAFGVTGVWKLIPREKGKSDVGMVDYISTNPGYGYIIMLPYQYAGGIEYNVFHNAAVRLPLGDTPFLPKEWRSVAAEKAPHQSYQNLWAVGRGPVSRGCTRLGSGHMTEVRHLLPSTSKSLERVESFRSLPQCFDLYDVDGDGSSEIVGVDYFYAYRTTKERKPWYAYAPNERKAFYKWLYGDNVYYDSSDRAFIKEAPLCRFGVRKAQERGVVQNIPLYEAKTPKEHLQFYKPKQFPADSSKAFAFTRELSRISSAHETDKAALQLR